MGVKRPALLIGGVILLAAGAAGAWLTGSPDTAPRATKAATSPPTSIMVPQAAVPPEPTSTDFASAAPTTTVPPPTTAPRRQRHRRHATGDSATGGSATAAQAASAAPATSVDWTALAIDELRTRANADEIPAMEEMARRLVQGAGVPKDQQAGAGWLLRAAAARLGAVGLQCRCDV